MKDYADTWRENGKILFKTILEKYRSVPYTSMQLGNARVLQLHKKVHLCRRLCPTCEHQKLRY